MVRGQKVILDCDLAHIFGVPTKRLNEQVRRNDDRFPSDFAFQLALQEVASLKSQIATSSCNMLLLKMISFSVHHSRKSQSALDKFF